MSALREVLAKFGIEVETEKLDNADSKIAGLGDKLKTVGKLFAAGALAVAIKDFANEMKEAAAEVKRTSNQLGIGAQDLQRWQYAAKASGVDNENLSAGLRFLQKNAYEAATAGGEAADVFKKLGVEVKGTDGQVRDTSTLFRDVAIAFSKVRNPAERTALAMKILGRGGAALNPLFNKGAEGLAHLLDEFEDLGGGLSADSLEAIGKYSAATKRLDFAMLSLKGRIAVYLLPYLAKTADTYTKLVNWIRKATEGTQTFNAILLVVQGTMIALAAKAAIMAAKMLAPYAPLIATVLILFLVLEDLLTLFKGGDSAIGRFVDSLFGVGTAAGIVKGLKTLWQDLLDVINGAPGAIDKLTADFLASTKSIARFFEKDIPEALAFAWRDIKAWGSNLGNQFKQWATGLADDFVNGLVNGLKEGASKVTEAIKGLGKDIAEGFRDFFQIHSPSKVMAQMGLNLDMGLVQGIAQGAPSVRTEANETLGGAFPASVRLPALGGPTDASTRKVEQRNTISVTIQGTGAGVASDVRTGLGLAFSDERNELLSALETGV